MSAPDAPALFFAAAGAAFFEAAFFEAAFFEAAFFEAAFLLTGLFTEADAFFDAFFEAAFTVAFLRAPPVAALSLEDFSSEPA
ncbi:hypothetical protein [Caballeronia sp. RCC_10]|uniref:hypothetical protein n=1 Tax=Caballeronia sp. RCC_10 TaxID=3239227 RepID=UPI0035266769